MAYRVDNIPLLVKPFFYVYSIALAVIGYAFLIFTRLTCRVISTTKAPLPPNAIYAIWHENLFPYFITNLRYKTPYSWMNHPLWFMKPVHLILRFMGVKNIFLGSTGHGGMDALSKVVEYLKKGHSTLIACDGPAGPYKDLKQGVLEMSLQSGVPVVPIQFKLSKAFRLKGWDKKRIPLPFSRIEVIFHKPILVNEANYDQSKKEIAISMG